MFRRAAISTAITAAMVAAPMSSAFADHRHHGGPGIPAAPLIIGAAVVGAAAEAA